MPLEFLNLTPEQIAGDEVYDPTKGARKRDTGDKVGDAIMSILTGTNYKEEVDKITKQNYIDKQDRTYGSRIGKVKDLAGYENLTTEGLGDLTPQQIEEALGSREGTKNAITKASVTYGVDASELQGLTDPGEILTAAAGIDRTRTETRDQDPTRPGSTAYAAAQANENRNWQRATQRENQAFRQFTAEENRKSREADRTLQREKNDQTLQLAIMDRADSREERKMRREDRDAADRRQSIMALVKGLTQLGAGFAI